MIIREIIVIFGCKEYYISFRAFGLTFAVIIIKSELRKKQFVMIFSLCL